MEIIQKQKTQKTYNNNNIYIKIAYNSTCYVDCYNNACNNVYPICEIDDNCTFIIDCTYAEKSAICPNGYEIPSFMYSAPSLMNVPMSTIKNSYTLCENEGVTYGEVCDGFQECYLDSSVSTLSSGSILAPICCTARSGCHTVTEISSENSLDGVIFNQTNYTENVAIRCDGSFSCQASTLIKAYIAGNMYFTSRNAGYDVTTIEGNTIGDIFCTGTLACSERLAMFYFSFVD